MPSIQNSGTYTMRLPDDLRTRLENSAANRNLSLNQFILDLIEQHYKAAGFADGATITANGRELEIRVKRTAHPPGMPMCFFYLDDPARRMEIACYTIGFSSQFMWQLGIDESKPYEVIAELGKAMLHYFNKQGLDITRLEWSQFPTIANRRILQMQDGKTRRTEAFIRSAEQFLSALQEDLWSDRLISVRSRHALDAKSLDEALGIIQQNKELKMDYVVEFEPTKRHAKIEEAIEEAVSKAQKQKCTFRFDCNDFVMIIDSNSDVNSLINSYWEFKHSEGIQNGSIISVPYNYPTH